jgi:hypothetical protein
MATLIEILQFSVGREADAIHHLKTEAEVWETFEKYAYVSPNGADGSLVLDRQPTDEERAAGFELKKVQARKLVGHMSPKRETWRAYQTAKRRASLLLTARHLLALGDGAVPDWSAVRKALGAGRLSHHLRRGQRAPSLCGAAMRYLRELANRLERAPERFVDVDVWARERAERSVDA